MPLFSFLEHPAIHSRLSSGHALSWSQPTQRMVLNSVLCPGLPAELYHSLCEMPLQANQSEESDLKGISWRCDFQVPGQPDPQHAESFYRLHRFLEVDLLQLAQGLVGHKMGRAHPGTIRLLVMRKGSFIEAMAPSPDHVGFLLSLTVGNWPIRWGGQLEVDGAQCPLGWNRLHLIRDGYKVSLLQRHVEVLCIHGWLEPVE